MTLDDFLFNVMRACVAVLWAELALVVAAMVYLLLRAVL